ncbi:NAD-dependent protein deacetylase [Spirochaetia bacterium]|nr:NAD-dependent protein deacetylase [Spirochaetia bacterium]
MNNDIADLCSLIAGARHCVALTGAGISTLSGIPDFRGAGGLYTAAQPSGPVLSERVFDIDTFEQDPTIFYKEAGPIVYTVDEKVPSIVHTALAALEQRGRLKAVITQNIDLLHQKAGSSRVFELHGSPRTHYCLHCAGIRVSYEEAAPLVKAGEMPRCPKCGRVLKPAITFYGEPLPIDALRDAEAEAQAADLMLVLGTSLQVHPAADIPRTCLRNGGRLVIVNATPTYLDSAAILRFDDLAPVFEEIQRKFGTVGESN